MRTVWVTICLVTAVKVYMQLKKLHWIHWGQVWTIWFVTRTLSLCIGILSWNSTLLLYLPRTSNTKCSYYIIGDGNISSIKPPKEKRRVGKTSGLWPHLCSVTFLYGRLQNHINNPQQLFSSLGFSFPSLHCPKANKPFHLQVFLHSKFNAFGDQCAVQCFLSPCNANCSYVVNVIENIDWVLFFYKPLSWRCARQQTPVRQVYNLCEGARYALHGLITWRANVPTVSVFAFTDSSGNSYLGYFFLNGL